MIIAYIMRKKQIMAWFPYILVAGTLSWVGFIMAHLHPALALVPIVPFLPGPSRDTGMFTAEDETDQEHQAGHHEHDHSPLQLPSTTSSSRWTSGCSSSPLRTQVSSLPP